jgi:hypothetical protein
VCGVQRMGGEGGVTRSSPALAETTHTILVAQQLCGAQVIPPRHTVTSTMTLQDRHLTVSAVQKQTILAWERARPIRHPWLQKHTLAHYRCMLHSAPHDPVTVKLC